MFLSLFSLGPLDSDELAFAPLDAGVVGAVCRCLSVMPSLPMIALLAPVDSASSESG
jgi:hypothetical protein